MAFSSIAAIVTSKQQAKAAKQAAAAQVGATEDASRVQVGGAQAQLQMIEPVARQQAQATARQMWMMGAGRAEIENYLKSVGSGLTGASQTLASLNAPAAPAPPPPPPSPRFEIRGGRFRAGVGGNGEPAEYNPDYNPSTPPYAPPSPSDTNAAWADNAWTPTNSVGANYAMSEAEKAVKRRQSASGRFHSPSTDMALQDRLTQIGYGFHTDDFNKWGVLGGNGQASSDAGGVIRLAAGDVADNKLAAGDARASGYLRVANARAMGNEGWAKLGSSAANFFMKNPWGG